MKKKLFTAVLLSAFCTLFAADLRQFSKPEWQRDVTNRIVRSDGRTMPEVLDRVRRSTEEDAGRLFSASLKLPDDLPATPYGAVLEFDFGTHIKDFKVDGVERRGIWRSGYWDGDEFAFPLGTERGQTVTFRYRALTNLYPNSFGRARIRPATLADAVRLEKIRESIRKLKVRNNTAFPLNAELNVRYTDYFGVLLKQETRSVQLSPFGDQVLSLEEPPRYWRAELTVQDGKRKGLPHLHYPSPSVYNVARPEVMVLRDGWFSAPGAAGKQTVPKPERFEPATVPLRWNSRWKEKSHDLWLKRTLSVPAAWKGKRIALYFPDLRYRADLFINGKLVGTKSIHQTPGKIDLSSRVRPGESAELMLRITDFTALLAEGIPVPPPGKFDVPDRAFLSSVSIARKGMMPSLETAPELLAVPEVRIEHAGIRTFVENGKRLQVLFELENDSGKSGNYTLFSRIYRNGSPVRELPAQKVRFSEGEKKRETALEIPWEDALLWSPDTPVLYELRTELKDPEGKAADLRRDRFGFREFKVAGRHFRLNGKPFQAGGFSGMGVRYILWPFTPRSFPLGRHGLQCEEKTTYGVSEEHRADETGMCLKAENTLHCGFGQARFAYQDPRFWANLKEHMKHLIRAAENHPSILLWDIGNENYFPLPGEAERMGKFIAEIREMDPTRTAHAGGAGVFPKGPAVNVLDIHGFGEPNRRTFFFLHPEQRPASLLRSGIYNYMPKGENPENWQEAFRWDYLLDPLVKSARHIGGRLMFFGECMYNHADSFPGLSGENLFHPLERDNERIHKFDYPQKLDMNRMKTSAVRKYQLRFLRESEAAGFLGHIGRGITSSIAAVAVFPDPSELRFREGSAIRIPFHLYNNTAAEQKISLVLRLKDGEKTVAERKLSQTLPVGRRICETVDFGIPEGRGLDRRLDLFSELETENGAWFSDWNEVVIFAEKKFSVPEGIRLSVYDPSGSVESFLQTRNVKFTRLSTPSAWKGGNGELLLAGPDSLSDQKDCTGLAEKLKKTGGRILVLDHRKIPQLAPFRLENGNEEYFFYPLKNSSPAYFHGMTEQDLRFWRTPDKDLLVSRNAIPIPTRGNFQIGALGGTGTKGGTTPLLEVPCGPGSVVFAQLNFSRALGTEPAAERLLANLLHRKERFVPRRTAALGKQDFLNALEMRTGYSGPKISSISELSAETGVLLLDGRIRLSPDAVRRLKEWILQGGTCWINGAEEATAPLISELSDMPCTIREHASDRAHLTIPDPVTANLSSGDFFWMPRQQGTDLYLPPPSQKPLKPAQTHPLHRELVWEGSTALLTPNALARMKKGKGELLVSTLRLNESPLPEANLLWSVLLTNLGVTLDFAADSGEDEKNIRLWQYTPIDLKAFCNRALQDDPGSPVRGWVAEGPAFDMVELPTGTQRFRGNLFYIIPPSENGKRSIIALSGTKEKGRLPAEMKNIPVKRKFRRLVFLYSAAYGAPDVTFRIWYADRKTWIPGAPKPYEELHLRPHEDIADWYDANRYLQREKTMPKAKLAWTGHTPHSRKAGRKIGIFLYEWENPNPTKEIDAIDVLSPGISGKGQFFLLAVSGANPLPKRSWKEIASVANGPWKLHVAEKGCVTRIVRTRDNRTLMNAPLWIIQGNIRHSRGIQFLNLGVQGEGDQQIHAGDNTISIRGEIPQIRYSTTISAIPDGFRFHYKFRILQTIDKALSPSLRIPIQALNGAKAVESRESNPLRWEWADGQSAALYFPTSWNVSPAMFRKATFVPFYGKGFDAGLETEFDLEIKFSESRTKNL